MIAKTAALIFLINCGFAVVAGILEGVTDQKEPIAMELTRGSISLIAGFICAINVLRYL